MYSFCDNCVAPYVVDPYDLSVFINRNESGELRGYYSMDRNEVIYLDENDDGYFDDEYVPSDFIKLPDYYFEVKPLAESMFLDEMSPEAFRAALPECGNSIRALRHYYYADYAEDEALAMAIVLHEFEQKHGIKLIVD